VEPPGARHTLQPVLALVLEGHAGVQHVDAHSLADQHSTGRRQVAESLGNGDGQTGDVITTDLDLTGVDSDPQVQADALGAGEDLGGAAQRLPRGVKGGEESISDGLDLPATMASERGPDRGVVLVRKPGPGALGTFPDPAVR
jgi:hypothetical protein